jgi:indoleamine 2,3-dioxygenase
MKLGGFRDKHIQIVSRYVILPASRPAPQSSKYEDVRKNRVNLASATSYTAADSGNNAAKPREEKVFYGTGGTDLIPFLKATRDETKAAARFVD